MEILREHALVMLHDLPRALGMETNGASIAGLGSLSVSGLAALEANLFGYSAADFLRRPEDAAATGDTLPLRLLRRALGWPAEWGAAPIEGDPTFFVRCLSDPLIARQAKGGVAPLHLRMLARLREAARLIEDIRSGALTRRYGPLGNGGGWADAARGRLVHQVELIDETIADYRIATPTETMIAPGGFLERLLNSALAAPPEERDAVFAVALGCARPCLEVSTSEKAA
jgi:hypothetical protein